MARVGLLLGGAACVALATLCAVLVTDKLSYSSVSLIAKVPHHAGQRSELAALLKMQLNDQVKNQENQMFHSTLKQEGIADALKKEGFALPSTLGNVALRSSRSIHQLRKVQKRLRSTAVRVRRARKSQAEGDLPVDVKLAQAILHGGVKKDLALPAKAVPRSKIVLNTVIEAKASAAGRKQAKAEEFLKNNVQEADEITKLAKKHSEASRKKNERMNMEIAQAAEFMHALGPHNVRRRHAQQSVRKESGEEVAIEAELKAKLNAVVQHRETNDYIRSVSDTVTHMQGANTATDSLKLASQSIEEGARSSGTRGKKNAHPMSRIQLEHALKDKLDDLTQSLEQKDLYRTELYTAPSRQDSVSLSVPPLSQSTFGGLNIKRSPESSLEQELRAELNSNVQSQEQHLFHSDAKAFLH